MINFKIGIKNPWFKYTEGRNLFNRHGNISKNKGWEIEIGKWAAYDIIDIRLDLSWKGSDHAGPNFEINVIGYMFKIAINDSRHWDFETGKWEVYSDDN
jgi:hypothetical protein